MQVSVSNFHIAEDNGELELYLPSLNPDHRFYDVCADIRSRSITPTTFISREFDNNISDSYHYNDVYRNKDNEITSLGIILEVILLSEAITHVLSKESCKTVVVDIFAQGERSLKVDQNFGNIETHSILLYKNPSLSDQFVTFTIDITQIK